MTRTRPPAADDVPASPDESAPTHDELRGARLQLVVTALLFSTGGAAIKACGLTSWQIAGFRSGVAGLALWLLVPAARRLGRPGRSLLVGLAYAATVILFVQANKHTTAANSIFLQSSAPMYVLLLGPWLLGERFARGDLAVMAAVATGLALFFVDVDAPMASAPDPLLGNTLGAIAGLSWAFTLLGLRMLALRTRDDASGLVAVVWGNLIAFAVCLPLALPVQHSTPTDWALVAFLGLFQIGFAYRLMTSGMRHVPALEASLILLLEPAVSPLWAWLVQGETPGPGPLVGGLLILGATTAKIVVGGRPRAG